MVIEFSSKFINSRYEEAEKKKKGQLTLFFFLTSRVFLKYKIPIRRVHVFSKEMLYSHKGAFVKVQQISFLTVFLSY